MKLLTLIVLSVLVSCAVQAQSVAGDLSLLQEQARPKEQADQNRNRTRNPLTLGYLLGIKIYQRAISEQLATDCAFDLTCSRFSKALVKDYGFFKGYFLTFDRVSRCTKISMMETYPVRLNAKGKIIETTADFHFH